MQLTSAPAFLMALSLALLSFSLRTSATDLVPVPLNVGCTSASSSAWTTYQSSASQGKIDCNYDMSNCNDNPHFLWAPVDSVLLPSGPSGVAAPCLGNLISGVTSVAQYSYVLGLFTEGDLPLDDETQAHIVRTSDGHVLASANILDLESVNGTDSYTQVTAKFSPPVALNANSTYALYFCYVGNASVYSDIYVVNLFQSQQASVPTHVASCLQYEDEGGNYPCYSSFGYAAAANIFNEFATVINFTCSSPSQSQSPSPSPSHYASHSPSSTPSRNPNISPSSSPAPAVQSLTNVTATFNTSQPSFTFGGSSANSSTSSITMQAGLTQIMVGGSPVSVSSYTVNSTSSASATTYVYTAQLNDHSALVQNFSFLNQPNSASFAGVEVPIPSGAVKWSIDVTTTQPMAAFALTYQLSAQTFKSSSVSARDTTTIISKSNTPLTNMTTYYLSLGSSSTFSGNTPTAVLEVFDVVLVDGALVRLQHSVSKLSAGQYSLVLNFPACNSLLKYDPTMSLGFVKPSDTTAAPGSDSAGGSDQTGLIVGLAVGLPAAFCLLALVAGAAVAVVVVLRRRGGNGNRIIFDYHDNL